MEFFNKFFGEGMYELNNGELAVCCPFPHSDKDGNIYYEHRASAHVNPDKDVFHCKVCGKSHSEASFLAEVQGISYGQAIKLINELEEKGKFHANWGNMVDNLKASEPMMRKLRDLGIDSVIDTLEIGYRGSGIDFPVRVFGEVLDIRSYRPNQTPKVVSEPGTYPLILPFDLWREDERDTLLCAGEKDMAISRVYGFNAITFTGGELAFPKLFKHSFKGKRIFIAYDNDSAGYQGSRKVATELKEAGAEVFIVDLSPVCAGQGEDIHNFFKKYKNSANDLQKMMDEAKPFSQEDYDEVRNEIYQLVRISDSFSTAYTGKLISSRVSVISKYDRPMEVPEVVEMKKTNESDRCMIRKGTEWLYSLEERNIQDVMMLCDSGLKKADVLKNLKAMQGIPDKELFIRVAVRSSQEIYKAVVSDDMESEQNDGKTSPAELTVYSLFPLDSGKKYRIFYKRFPHPLQSQEIVGIVTRVEESDTSIRRFKATPEMLESVKCFQAEPGKLNEKMEEIAERAKAIAGVETMREMAWMVDLFYHTPLDFMFGERKERAYLDMMIVGEPRSGKSQTSMKLMQLYELGVITSLKTATKAGLIGGSDQTGGGYRTKIGLLPRNHEGAVIMEEFSGGGREVVSQLTEIRSSNMARITRVNGTTVVPCKVRMLSISNPKTGRDGQSLPIRQYPHGIKVLLELVGASEDIARYDLFMLVDKPESYTRPNEKIELEAFPTESYLNRVRWIWSRTPEQVVIGERVQDYIVDCADRLNQNYDSHINFFGAEAWKKLSRVAIAVAAMVCSYDETGEKLNVTEEHVQWAMHFMISRYDNQLFRLKQYVGEQRKYTTCNDQAVQALQGIYNRHATFVNQLEMASEMNLNQLRSVSGLDNDEFTKLVNRLAECYFIHYGDRIAPSERFRKAAALINRDIKMKGVGGW